MFAAINILFVLLVPSVFALAAILVSLVAVRRRITFRQMILATMVLSLNLTCMFVLFQRFADGQGTSALALCLIGMTFVLAIAQFIFATVLSAFTRLRRNLA